MFITFEGGEGVGKSTIIKQLSQLLINNNIKFVITREPGGTKKSEEVRKILLSNKNLTSEQRAELFVSARIDHNQKVIIPKLSQNNIVLCDRYFDSTFVYQGLMISENQFDMVLKKNMNEFITVPDITFIFDIDPKIAQERLEKNNREVNFLDNLPIEHHNKIREYYLSLENKKLSRYPKYFSKTKTVIIDASKSVEEITNIILPYVL